MTDAWRCCVTASPWSTFSSSTPPDGSCFPGSSWLSSTGCATLRSRRAGVCGRCRTAGTPLLCSAGPRAASGRLLPLKAPQ